MYNHRILVFGDNHGDTESLERIVDETDGEEFDFIVHTGDITNTWKTSVDEGVKQLKSIEQYFETLAEKSRLVYIYGNRDKKRSVDGKEQHVTDQFELSVGNRLEVHETIEVGGQRFTADPNDSKPDDIVLTHALHQPLFYQVPGRAYFCGDTHRARQRGRALNTGYLHNDKGFLGAYFVATVDQHGLDVEVRGVDEPWKELVCPDHQWYDRQFTPAKFGCRLCKFGSSRQFSGMSKHAFRAVTDGGESEDSAEISEIVMTAREQFVDSDEFASQFRTYLEALATNDSASPMDPLVPVDGYSERLQSR